MNLVQLETKCASAERSSPEEIQELNDKIKRDPVACQILEGMPSMAAILDQNRQIVLANEELVRTLGTEDLDFSLGQRPGELAGCPHAEDSPSGCGTSEACRSCGALTAILAAQNGRSAAYECSLYPRSQIEALDLRIKSSPLNINGLSLTIFAIQDIAQEKRIKLLERTFFHDILNAAGGVMGLATLMNDSEDMDEVQEFAPLLATQAEQLVAAIESQRDLLAAERGSLLVSTGPVGSLTMIQAAIDLYRVHEVAQGKTIRKDPEAARIILNTSKTLLQRTLGNMLKNALEASEPGQTVTLGCDEVTGQARFWVHNELVMPSAMKNEIFKRSFSTKGDGRGLGTYSIRLLGEKYLGGQVGFSSEEGAGTIFWIQLPSST